MADPAFAASLRPHFGPNLVVIDPANPEQAELGIVRYLKSVDAEQSTKTARPPSGARQDLLKLLRRGARYAKAAIDAILLEIGEAPLTEEQLLS
jgi:hypothetical protein